jgi:hypothetical protein
MLYNIGQQCSLAKKDSVQALFLASFSSNIMEENTSI